MSPAKAPKAQPEGASHCLQHPFEALHWVCRTFAQPAAVSGRLCSSPHSRLAASCSHRGVGTGLSPSRPETSHVTLHLLDALCL